MTAGLLRLRISAHASNLAVARAFISTSLRIVDQPQTTIDDLRLAVSELLATLVTENHDPIDLELAIGERTIQTTITGPEILPLPPAEITRLVDTLTHDGLELRDSSWVIRLDRQ